MKFVLAFVASDFINFRLTEYTALLQLAKLDVDDSVFDKSRENWSRPYVVVDLPGESEAIAIAERSVLIKSVYQLWCDAGSLSELYLKIPDLPGDITKPYLGVGNTFKIIISSANKKIPHETKIDIIDEVLNAHKHLEANVSLSNPQHQINLLLEYAPRNWFKGSKPNLLTCHLCHVFYGRLVACSTRRQLMNNFRLSDRAYLGNTSMNVQLAGIMANVSLSRAGSLVWDPFIGTGSIVLAASIWGAFGAGSDIDFALLHGMGMSPKAGQGRRADDECLRVNYRQYGLESRFLDVVVADATSLHRLLRVSPTSGLFDAILTDPPYGFRERSCRVAHQPRERPPSLVTQEKLVEITGLSLAELSSKGVIDASHGELAQVPHDLPHYPHKETYPVQEAYNDLFNLSVCLLRPGGRLVCWLPVQRATFSGVDCLPWHPRLRLLAACEQVLNARNSRYLLVLEKLMVTEPDISVSENASTVNFSPADLARSLQRPDSDYAVD